jgi:hypothetical protein
MKETLASPDNQEYRRDGGILQAIFSRVVAVGLQNAKPLRL